MNNVNVTVDYQPKRPFGKNTFGKYIAYSLYPFSTVKHPFNKHAFC